MPVSSHTASDAAAPPTPHSYTSCVSVCVLSRLLPLLPLLLQVASVVSDSVRPHRRQPTRLLCPWESPGKNTGVGCNFLLQRMHGCLLASVMSNSVLPHGQQPTRLLCPQESPGKNTGVGCHFLLLFIHDYWQNQSFD